MQPSFTVLNTRGQSFKIDHVMSMLSQPRCNLFTLCFKPMAWKWPSFNKFKPLNIWMKMIFCALFSLAKVAIFRSIHSAQVIWRSFWLRKFPAFQLSLKFGLLVYSRSTLQRLCSVFLFDFIKRNSNLCQMYYHWNWFGFWWRRLGNKNMHIPDFYGQDDDVFLTGNLSRSPHV